MKTVFEIETPCTVYFETGPTAPLIIYRGRNVYHVQSTVNPVTAVKFPMKGKYFTSSDIAKVQDGIVKPRKVENPCRPDRSYSPENCKVQYNAALSLSPARIFYEKGIIEVGPVFYTLPLQFQVFILEHEKGHCLYSQEEGADVYALNSFMQQGFNASQAYFALSDVIRRSPENIARIKNLFELTSNFYK